MKKLLSVVLQLLALCIYAQAPREVNYQGAARDEFGVPIVNKTLNIRFDILQGSSTTVIFTETQSISTNSLGLFSTQIGKTKNLGTVNLENGALQLRVLIDADGSGNFIDLGLQRIVSVPFALHAGSVPTSYTNNVLTVGSKTYALQSPSLTITGANALGIVGSNTVDITPTVTFTNSILTVGRPTNSVIIPATNVTLTGTGAANVTTLVPNSFSLNVASQSLSILSPATLSITGANSVLLPTVALTTSGLAQVTGGPLNYNIAVPPYTYNTATGDLTSGTNVINITPPLALNGTSISAGPLTNFVDLSVLTPWRDGPTTVTLAVNSDLVGIGTAAPNAKLDVQHNGTTAAFNAQNTNVSTTAYAGTFDGGIVTRGKNTLSTANALIAQNSANTNLFVVKNNADIAVGTNAMVMTNGNMGINNAAPTERLDVTGNMRMSGALMPNNLSGAAGQFLQSMGANTAPLWTSGGLLSAGTTNYVPKWSTATGLTSTSQLYDNGANVGIGTANPVQKLDVNGILRVGVGSTIADEAWSLSTPAAGLSVLAAGQRGSTEMRFDQSNNGFMSFRTAAAERMRITSAGNVGVGFNSPTTTFAVGSGGIQKLGILGSNGSMIFTDESGSITFAAAATATLAPMINMFASGISNAKRMVIQHSPSWPSYGLQYEDQTDRFHFIGNDLPVLTADLSSYRVGVGTFAPLSKLHVLDNITSEVVLIQNQSTSAGTGLQAFANTAGSGGRFGVVGVAANSSSGFQTGVQGSAGGGSQSFGVRGIGTGGSTTYNIGVLGDQGGGTGSYGGYFNGPVQVSGLLSKSGGTFRIDHPQDPTNKYLIHSFVESPDMMNIYNGNITTDANGDALVQLPTYFEAENIQYRYQLTVIGQFAQAIVSEEIQNNQFRVKTDKPNVKVSWQVTGVRNDEFAKKHRVVPEVEKTGKDKGRYIHPELYGFGIEMREGPGNPNDTE